MSDPIQMEKAIRLLLKLDDEGEFLLADAARFILCNALEGKPFSERTCIGACHACGAEKTLPISRGGYLGLCAECAEKGSPELAKERRG